MKLFLSYLIVSVLTFSSVTANSLTGKTWVDNYGKENFYDDYLSGVVRGYIKGKSKMGWQTKMMIKYGNLKLVKHKKQEQQVQLYKSL